MLIAIEGGNSKSPLKSSKFSKNSPGQLPIFMSTGAAKGQIKTDPECIQAKYQKSLKD